MKKTAQPSQYSYAGYSPSMDNLALLPGVAPQIPEKNTPDWLLPLGAAAGGLAGYALLRGAGRGLKGLLRKLRNAGTPIKHDPWNWEMEMLGRDAQKQYRSVIDPKQTIGHGYGPGPENIVKQSSIFPSIITCLGQIAHNK